MSLFTSDALISRTAQRRETLFEIFFSVVFNLSKLSACTKCASASVHRRKFVGRAVKQQLPSESSVRSSVANQEG